MLLPENKIRMNIVDFYKITNGIKVVDRETFYALKGLKKLVRFKCTANRGSHCSCKR